MDIQEQMGSLSRELETLRQNLKKMPEMKSTINRNEKMPLMGSSVDCT